MAFGEAMVIFLGHSSITVMIDKVKDHVLTKSSCHKSGRATARDSEQINHIRARKFRFIG